MLFRSLSASLSSFLLLALILVPPVRGEEVHGGWSSRVIAIRELADSSRNPAVVTSVSIHPKGHLLATAGDDHRVLVWKVADGARVQRLEGHSDWVRAVAHSPDGSNLATAGNDGKVILWDAEDGQQLRILAEHARPISAIRYSPDGGLLATIGFADILYVYEVSSGRQLFNLDCPCRDMRSLAFSPDGKSIAAGGRNGKVRLWRTSDGKKTDDLPLHRQRVRDLAFSSDSRRLVTCSDDRIVNVVDLASGSSTQLPAQPCKVFALAMVDDDRLATAGSDNMVKIWNLSSREVVATLSGHSGTVSTLVSHRGLLISGSFDTTVRIWSEENNVAGEQSRPVRRVGQSEFNVD